VGWMRADLIPSGATLTDILTLRERVADLEEELERSRSAPPPGTEDLMQGEDDLVLNYDFEAGPSYNATNYEGDLDVSWNDIFSGVAPAMINEASDFELRRAFRRHFTQRATETLAEDEELQGKALRNFSFKDHDIDTCIIQIRALGLIRESEKKRSVKDIGTYWTLTPYGDRLMVQLRALRRSPPEHRRTTGVARQALDAEESGGHPASEVPGQAEKV
jgi:hypothetical protein